MDHYIYYEIDAYRVADFERPDAEIEVETGEKFYEVYYYEDGTVVNSEVVAEKPSIEYLKKFTDNYQPEPDYDEDEQPDVKVYAVVYECYVEVVDEMSRIESVDIDTVSTLYTWDADDEVYKLITIK